MADKSQSPKSAMLKKKTIRKAQTEDNVDASSPSIKKGLALFAKAAVMDIIKEATTPGMKRKSNSKLSNSPGSRKQSKLGHQSFQLHKEGHASCDDILVQNGVQSSEEKEQVEEEQPKIEKDSDDEGSDMENILKEADPRKRHIAIMRLKNKKMEENRPKPRPRLSYEKRGWNAPQDEPYVPVGRMMELVDAFKSVRQSLPHTRDRFKKATYRSMLVVQKRERDHADKLKRPRANSGKQSGRDQVGSPRSSSVLSGTEVKMDDTSRVVAQILPSQRQQLIELRKYAYEEQQRELVKRRESAPGPRLNKLGKIAAGFVVKKNEQRDNEIARKKKLYDQMQLRNSQNKKEEEDAVPKSDIEIQMENEKSRHWIRKRNGKIYDEKIKNMILTTDNGASLLKQEIQESELRLASVKLGRPLNEVVPKHPDDYFLNNKEDYFLGEKKVLRRQERETAAQEEEKEELEEPKIQQVAKEFQTINSADPLNSAGGFFLTEQPIVSELEDRANVVPISNLIGTRDVLLEEPVKVSQMFASAQDADFEKVYRATTSQVKGLYLRRLNSRNRLASEGGGSRHDLETACNSQQNRSGEGKGFKHTRAGSFSTAAVTAHGFYRSGANIQHQLSSTSNVHPTLNSNQDTDRLKSAMTQIGTKHRRHPTGVEQRNTKRLDDHFMYASEQQLDVDQANSSILLNSDHQLASATGNYNTNQGNNRLEQSRSATGAQSQMTFNGAKRLLQDAKSKRTQSLKNALQADVGNSKNRVRHLQNLQKERMAKKKLDHAAGSNIFNGFSQEEVHEILVEMPQLKKMAKDKINKAMMGPSQPQFSKAKLIHLDGLNDIANRGQAEARQRVFQQIDNRRKKWFNDISFTDNQYEFDDPIFVSQQNAFMNNNQAILRKFQNAGKDGSAEDIPTNYNFEKTLKQRLNFADARHQRHLYENFRDTDDDKLNNYVYELWGNQGPDHTRMDSERQGNNSGSQQLNMSMQSQKGWTLKTLMREPSLNDKIGHSFNEYMASNLSQPQLRKQGTVMKANESMNLTVSDLNKMGKTDGQKQVDDEMAEFDHSEQKILMKLIEIYEARIKQTIKNASSFMSNATSLLSGAGLFKSKVSIADPTTFHVEEPVETTRQFLNIKVNVKPAPIIKERGKSKSGQSNLKKPDDFASTIPPQVGSIKPPLAGRYGKGSDRAQKIAAQTAKTAAIMANPNLVHQKRNQQIKKDYRNFAIGMVQKEYWRAFEALMGSNNADMDAVMAVFDNNNQFYRMARDFLVIKGKFMTEDHLIHLKEDPKTILSLYRLQMLQYKTSQMSKIEEKLRANKKKKVAKKTTQERNDSALSSFDKAEDSDYSDADFQDLMSNKQIEENIKVFFDRMHELVNPIDHTRLKLDSVQQIKSTVKTFYKKKADLSDKLLTELDQMTAERPDVIKIKQGQFNDPESNQQANLHGVNNLASMPMGQQQCRTRMTDVRLNTELYRLRNFKTVAYHTSQWYNELVSRILAENYQDEPLVLYMLDQIKNVIEIGDIFTRHRFRQLMDTFDVLDAVKPEVIKMHQFLDDLLPHDHISVKVVEESELNDTNIHDSEAMDAMEMSGMQDLEIQKQLSQSQKFGARSNSQNTSQQRMSNMQQRRTSKVTFELKKL